jgi:hypothetical protein
MLCALGQGASQGGRPNRFQRSFHAGGPRKPLTAKEAKKGFGRLIDIDRAVLMVVTKHGRRVVMVIAMVGFGRLTALPANR